MFWDRVAGIYDLFGNIYNGRVNRKLCKITAEEISPDNQVLECACGTGMISLSLAPRCARLSATDFSEGMIKRAKRKLSPYANAEVRKAGGKLIIPTYVNNEKTGKTIGFAKTVGKAGADFKRQFTFSNYRRFFETAGYSDIKVIQIPGRVPCAVAIIQKNGLNGSEILRVNTNQ